MFGFEMQSNLFEILGCICTWKQKWHMKVYFTGLVVNYGISNTSLLDTIVYH